MLHLSDDKEMNQSKLELETAKFENTVARNNLIIRIVDRISMNVGGIGFLVNKDEYIRALAEELALADAKDLIAIFDKIVKS